MSCSPLWAKLTFAASILAIAATLPASAFADDVRVLVWDEQQPEQKQAYDSFLGNWIAGYLKTQQGLSVRSARLADPAQGLSKEALDSCDVLIWWGHVRHRDIKPATAKDIVRRIKDGQLSLIALHSAHWSAPFVEAMNDRAIEDALKRLPEAERATAKIKLITPKPFTVLKYDDPLTPSARYWKKPDGAVEVTLTLPSCVFPAYRADAKPSQIRTLLPDHPIAKGLPARFTIPRTEMYDEPFHVPEPDAVIFEERWETGEWFRSGCLWQIGKGKVFYFRPGHELYPVYKEREVLQLLTNAARWLGSRQ
jgi:trehalose utilization protein